MSSRQQMNRNNEILEKHHILPRSLGGTNNPTNLVLLTPREHFIAHLLLTKLYTGKDRAKMIYAFSMMCQCNPSQKRQINSRYFSLYKKMASKYCIGENHPSFGRKQSNEMRKLLSEGRKGENNPMYGKDPWNKGLSMPPYSEERRNKISEANKGKILSDETKLKIGQSNKGKVRSEEFKKKLSEMNKGKPVSAETRKKLSEAGTGRKQKPLTCPHCNKEGRGSSMLRWHFDNCRSK